MAHDDIPSSTAFCELYKVIMETDFLSLPNFDTADQLSLPDGFQEVFWVDNTKTILIRNSWRLIIDIIVTKKLILLEGKSGCGKSLLVLYIIFRILFCARKNNGTYPNVPTDCDPNVALIYFKDRNGVGHVVHSDRVVIWTQSPPAAYFYLSDNCDIGDAHPGKILTMAVTSNDDDKITEFRKRLFGVGERGGNLFLPSLSLDEMTQVFPEDPEAIRTFKFNVVGGNLRMYHYCVYSATPVDIFYPLVVNVVSKLFGSEYVPSDTKGDVMTDKQKLGLFAIQLVVTHLNRAHRMVKTDSSLFREHYMVGNDFTQYNTQFSSRFLALVAGAVMMSSNTSIMNNDQFTRLFGMGSLFEQTAQRQMLHSTGDHYCLNVTDRCIVPLPFGNRNLMMFQNVADIRTISAADSVYAVPNICNFPVVDAILPPCYGLKMTVAQDLSVSNSELSDIVSGLGLRDNSDFHLVFVVPNMREFTPPTDLSGVHLYITTPECSTAEAALLSNLSKKRGSERCEYGSKGKKRKLQY